MKNLTKSWQVLEQEILAKLTFIVNPERINHELETMIKQTQAKLNKEYNLGDVPLSREAAIYDVASSLGIKLNREEKEMDDLLEISGNIEDKTMKEGMKDGKQWKRWTYKVGGLTLATFTELPFNSGQTVKVKYKDNVSGSTTYHNIDTMEKIDTLPANPVVKMETIGEVPKETPILPVEKWQEKRYDSTLGARQTALNAATAYAVGTKEPMTESKVLEVAETFHNWLTKR